MTDPEEIRAAITLLLKGSGLGPYDIGRMIAAGQDYKDNLALVKGIMDGDLSMRRYGPPMVRQIEMAVADDVRTKAQNQIDKHVTGVVRTTNGPRALPMPGTKIYGDTFNDD